MANDGIPSQETFSSPENHQQIHTLIMGGAVSLIGLFSWITLNFLFQFFLARFLGPSELGLFNLGFTVSNFIGLLLLLGLDYGALRWVAGYAAIGDKTHEKGAILSSLFVVGVTGLIATPFFFRGANFIAKIIFRKPDLVPLLQILIIATPFTAFTSLVMSISQAYKKFTYKSTIEYFLVPLTRLVGFLSLAVLIGATSPVGGFAVLFSAVFGAIAAVFVLGKLYPAQGNEIKVEFVLPQIMRFSLPFLFSSLIVQLNTHTETLMLGIFSNAEQLGIYSICIRITFFIIVFHQALNLSFTPLISELFARGEMQLLKNAYRLVIRCAFELAFPIALIIILFSKEILTIFGPAFQQGEIPLRILALAQIVFLILGPAGWVLGMTRYPHLITLNTAITLVFSLVIDYLLIPQYGALGAALAGGAAILFLRFLEVGELHFLLRVDPFDYSFLKPLLAGFFASLVAYGVKYLLSNTSDILSLILGCLTLTIGYLLLLVRLGLPTEEREVLNQVTQRFKLLK